MRDYYMRIAPDPDVDSQMTVSGLKAGDKLRFVREPNNPEDRYAVRIETMSGERVGYVSSIYSKRISISMTYGFKYTVLVSAVTKSRLGAGQYNVDLQVLYTVPDLSKIKRRKKSST